MIYNKSYFYDKMNKTCKFNIYDIIKLLRKVFDKRKLFYSSLFYY